LTGNCSSVTPASGLRGLSVRGEEGIFKVISILIYGSFNPVYH
jgi:hypothetical protein